MTDHGLERFVAVIDGASRVLEDVQRGRPKVDLTGADLLSGADLDVLCLHFSSALVTLVAKGVDDSLEIQVGPVALGEWLWDSVATEPPWNHVLGMTFFDAWLMTNAAGYTDAIQIEFCRPDEWATTAQRIQIEVAASRLHVWSVPPSANVTETSALRETTVGGA